MTLLAEHGADVDPRLRCRNCDGEGGAEVAYCPVGCHGSRTPEGCHHGRYRWEDCTDCDGSGRTACIFCGRPSEIVVDERPYCRPCGEYEYEAVA